MMDKYTPTAPAVLIAIVLGALSIILSFLILFGMLPVSAWLWDAPVKLAYPEAIQILIKEIPWLLFGGQAPPDLDAHGLYVEMGWRTIALLISATSASLIAGVYIWFTEKEISTTVRHISGRRLLDGDEAVYAANRIEANAIARCGQGLWLAPDVKMSRERETLQIAIMGSIGGGKTQLYLFLIEQIRQRNDKMVVHCTKGDYTSTWPDDKFILVSPTDTRTWAWDIAADTFNIQRARELAARLIPSAGDGQQMWKQGSRAILTGLIVRLQMKHQANWSWRDLLESSFLTPTEMKQELEIYYPEASKFVCIDPETGEPNLTSYGFFVGAQAPVAEIVGSLSAAWSDVPPERRISFVQWMLDDADRRPIILQRSSEYPELSATWIGAALDTIASIAGSNRLTDNFSRRIWLMIDELGQANISSNFQQVLLVGRSKGICAVLGLQDPNQLTQKFDDVTRKVFSSVIGTTIYTKFNAGETSQNISELIGNREIERKEETVAFASGNGGGRTTTFSTRHETVPVLLASELEKLGPRLVSTTFGKPKTEIEALVLGYGDALRLRWPLTIWPVMRPGNMPAAWLDPPTGPEMPDADEPELLE